MRDGDLVLAKKIIGEALTRDRTKGQGWLLLAQLEDLAGNNGLVSLLLRRGIECSPTDATLYRELGEHLVRKGQIDDARDVMEEGLKVNPMYAPLYHSLAELEARIFNVEGLANLNKRAAALFNTNALESPESSQQAMGARFRQARSNDVDERVSVLADKVGETIELKTDVDIESVVNTFESMSKTEDEVVESLFQDEDDLSFNREREGEGYT